MVKLKRKSKTVKPILSTKKELAAAVKRANKLMNKSISKKDKILLETIKKKFKEGLDTKKMFSKNGSYVDSRKKIHNKIIKKLLKQDTRTKNPDLYIFGGVGGSGKGTHLSKLVKEKAVVVNNDDIKNELAKITPSGSKRFFLIHAALLHREAQDVEKLALIKLLKGKRDIILDRTLSNFKKNLELVNKFRSKGYQITTFGTNLKPHVSIGRSTKRFLFGKEGRFVPVSKIAQVGNKINKNTLKMAKQPFNKNAKVINTFRRKPSTVFQK